MHLSIRQSVCFFKNRRAPSKIPCLCSHVLHPQPSSGPCSIEVIYPCKWRIAIPASLMRVDKYMQGKVMEGKRYGRRDQVAASAASRKTRIRQSTGVAVHRRPHAEALPAGSPGFLDLRLPGFCASSRLDHSFHI